MERRTVGSYESFLALPVAVVLAVLWVAGVLLAGAGVVALYEGASVLVQVLETVL